LPHNTSVFCAFFKFFLGNFFFLRILPPLAYLDPPPPSAMKPKKYILENGESRTIAAMGGTLSRNGNLYITLQYLISSRKPALYSDE